MEDIGEGLKVNRILSKLCLICNCIEDEEASTLSEVLKSNATLIQINVKGSGGRKKGVEEDFYVRGIRLNY